MNSLQAHQVTGNQVSEEAHVEKLSQSPTAQEKVENLENEADDKLPDALREDDQAS